MCISFKTDLTVCPTSHIGVIASRIREGRVPGFSVIFCSWQCDLREAQLPLSQVHGPQELSCVWRCWPVSPPFRGRSGFASWFWSGLWRVCYCIFTSFKPRHIGEIYCGTLDWWGLSPQTRCWRFSEADWQSELAAGYLWIVSLDVGLPSVQWLRRDNSSPCTDSGSECSSLGAGLKQKFASEFPWTCFHPHPALPCGKLGSSPLLHQVTGPLWLVTLYVWWWTVTWYSLTP